MKMKTIFLVGADTGGHVVPTYSLALELEKNTNIQVVVIGVGSEIEKKFYSKLSKSKYIKIYAGKSRFGSIWSKFVSYMKLFVGFVQSKYLIIKYRPKVVFLKGNYATLPIAFAAKLFGCPIIHHESDAVIGRSNKAIAKFSKKLFLSYPLEIYDDEFKQAVYSGPILREDFLSLSPPKDNDFQSFGFDKHTPIILVLGGSLGAKAINDCIFNSLDKILSEYQLIHQTGNASFQEAKNLKSVLPLNLRSKYYVSSFVDNELISAIKIADLVLSRSGSGVFELAAFKKAAILVPYPYASNDHQSANARYFSHKSAVKMIVDDKLQPTVLLGMIENLISDKKMSNDMRENFYNNSKLDGRDVIVAELNNYLK